MKINTYQKINPRCYARFFLPLLYSVIVPEIAGSPYCR